MQATLLFISAYENEYELAMLFINLGRTGEKNNFVSM